MMHLSPSMQPAWPDLKCFQHCDRSTNILCCVVPIACPICQQDTSTTPMRIPPYILPSPFVASSVAPCSLVLKPTTGDFIRDYTSTANLHIGITDTRGRCYDFDEEGLHVGNTWPHCLAVPVTTSGATSPAWDQHLTAFADPFRWNPQRYDEADCNCFDFVLQFLHYMGLQGNFSAGVLASKQAFCEEFLLQRTAKATQYIHLYRRVLKDGHVLSNAAFL
ncbi:hypothetical protein BaRGS_00032668 [Batillaria attramentaria]|uniref:MKRN2 opposite strand protein-like C-terminal domain-containing protein n=1 Tax=Batillaria attramentaria TaxID=370345 RepID=A0ABD0JMP0_9CAEN